MLPQVRAHLCVRALRRLCLPAKQHSWSAQQSKRKGTTRFSFWRFLALNFCHQLTDSLVHFSHFLDARRLALGKGNEFLNPVQLSAHASDQGLLAYFGLNFVKLSV